MPDINKEYLAITKKRLFILAFIATVFLVILLCRLWYLQLRHGVDYAHKIQKHSIRTIRLTAPRGRIYSSDHTPLVYNEPSYCLAFHISEMRQPGFKASENREYIIGLAQKLGQAIGRESGLKDSDIMSHGNMRPALPMFIFNDLSQKELTLLAEYTSPPPKGVEIIAKQKRKYNYPGTASHILGYAFTKYFNRYEKSFYSYNPKQEKSGRSGLEKSYNDILSGKPGAKMVRVDSAGFIHDTIGKGQKPEDGKDLILSLDIKAQRVAEKLLKGHLGSLVAIDVNTGAVLAMASSPTYDITELSSSKFNELYEDKQVPLRNRSIEAGYTPGSIVKPLVGLAALSQGFVTSEEPYTCIGHYKIGKSKIRCSHTNGHGSVNMLSALAQSCNPYFIEIGIRMGIDNLSPFYASAGIGTAPKIDIPTQYSKGVLPTRSYMKKVYKQNWVTANTAYVSMGQGVITMSPLQAAMFTAAIANGGTVYQPYLVKEIRDMNGDIFKRTVPIPQSRLAGVRKEDFKIVKQGMFDAVHQEYGTATKAYSSVIPIAAKTGTAEIFINGKKAKDVWCIGFAPFEEPQYAVCVFIQNSTYGGKVAAPILKNFLDEWLSATVQQDQ